MFVMKNEAPTVNNYEKTFKIIMDLSEKSKAKIYKINVTFAWLFLCINMILMAETLRYDARKLK